MTDEAEEHENFFIAKIRDSESAQHAFKGYSRVATRYAAQRSIDARITETTAAQVFPAILAVARARFSRIICIVAWMHRRVVDRYASGALAPSRQHFLKQDTVFSNVLVYSGCSAFRFPSARSD
jgi:hypothetical protein